MARKDKTDGEMLNKTTTSTEHVLESASIRVSATFSSTSAGTVPSGSALLFDIAFPTKGLPLILADTCGIDSRRPGIIKVVMAIIDCDGSIVAVERPSHRNAGCVTLDVVTSRQS